MGSVKDLIIIQKPEGSKLGLGRFLFSDRYSVFDWGEMPDHIEGKGVALCITSAYFFEELETLGVKTHYLGIIEDGKTKRLADLRAPQNTMEIKLVRVIKPLLVESHSRESGNPMNVLDPRFHGDDRHLYDYTPIKNERINILIPLEIIYRNSLPEGSSVFKRLKDGTLKLEALGLSEMPAPGAKLKKPLFDVSTKLESTDRYLSWDEARGISGLSDSELEELKKKVFEINALVTKGVAKAGLSNDDGKFEFGFDENRNLLLLDTVGTLDECRFTFGGVPAAKALSGMPVSKEILRMHYRRTAWYGEVESAKKGGGADWKPLVKEGPPKLPAGLKNMISALYKATCNEITGREWFKGVTSIKEILREITK